MTRGMGLALVGIASVLGLAMPPLKAQNAGNKPNVVFILADNVGYGALGSYGGELRGAPTPRLEQLVKEVEPACTPSRAALMTGQYSIRNGLSLLAPAGGNFGFNARTFTMGELFKNAGYATAIYGKWHLGKQPDSLPTAHGFDEFYGIEPDESWDSILYLPQIEMTHTFATLPKGPSIVEAVAGGPLRKVKPYTAQVRAEIDNELTARAIEFVKRQAAARKPFSSTCRSRWATARTFRQSSSRANRGLATMATR